MCACSFSPSVSSSNMTVFILCVLVILNYVDAAQSIKGLYCQDPDTGKLYPINSTWPSETFCGNYTCKLRKKNLTETEYKPITRINITQTHLESLKDDMSTSPSENSHSVVVMEKIDSTRQPVFHRDVDSKINELKEELKNNKSEGDRYLTESEIRTITEILHTIKKSDLEAIVEIYNIAQEIYKEMDSTADDLVRETMNSIKNDDIKIKKKPTNKDKSISYWYEPLHKHNSKGKPVDLKIEATNAIPTAPMYAQPAPYYNNVMNEKDSARSLYYYPESSFHREASYLHNSPYVTQKHVPKKTKPSKKNMSYVPPAWYNLGVKSSPELYRKAAQPMLLPYPFSYIHHYNFTHPASYYYSNYPWAQLDAYNRNRSYLQPYYSTYYELAPNTAIVANTEEVKGKYEECNEIKNKDTSKSTEDNLPDWQTEPLSANILEEIKANMPEKSKLLKPLRKNVKLEKVGKVIKIDESRSKRNANENSENDEKTEYEPYIERTTCTSSIEPGFFRVGNESEPYPACCPQKITSL